MEREPARVLVVDDDRDFREGIVSMLAGGGHLVSCAHDSARALHALRCGDTPDVIVCDIYLPPFDGYSLLRQLRQQRETQYTPVIFVSGDPDQRVRALERGGSDFLLKPVDGPELLARVACQLRVSRAERTWRRYSFVDPLTGLLNRRGFADPIAREVDRATRHHSALSIVFLDLDGFKDVNDHLGHDVGDTILVRFARILEQNLRGSDLAARWGGDEFVLGLPGSDRAAAHRIAERIRDTAENSFASLPTTLGVSAGVACLFEDSCDAGQAVASELIQCADHAMYRDKRNHQRFARGSTPAIQAVAEAGHRRDHQDWTVNDEQPEDTNNQECDL